MIKLVEKYLNDNKHYPSSNGLEEYYLSHPDYPSLFAIKDTLSQFNIESLALKLDLDNYENLPLSFITLFRGSLIYVLNKNNIDITYLTEDLVKKKVKKEELMNEWSGIVLLVEENENQKEIKKEYKANLNIIIIILITLLSFFIIEQSLINYILLILSISGLLLSKEILKTYFNKSQKENKFCSLKENFSCKSIINSNSTYLGKHIDFVDLTLLYFVSLYLCIILNFNFLLFFGLISSASLPVLAYSVYIQKIVVKKWCLLCLITSFLVFTIFILFSLKIKNLYFDSSSFINVSLIFFLTAFLWFNFKKALLTNFKNQNLVNSLLRFKRESNTFYKTSPLIKNIEKINELDKIKIGNKNTKNKLLLFITPSCHYCHVAIENAFSLIEKYPNKVYLEICYNLNPENTENKYLDIAKLILWNNNNKIDTKEMLIDLHIKKLNYSEWINKWYSQKDFCLENDQLKKHYEFCNENGFNFSPIRIFNDIFVSQHYEINELNYFFHD